MRIMLASSTQEAVEMVVNHLADRLRSPLPQVVGLATGRTMEPVYAELAQVVDRDKIELHQHHFFMLDEYLGLEESHPGSFRSYIRQRFLTPLHLSEDQMTFPPVNLIDALDTGAHYEQLIQEAGGIDLQLLGVGTNGHVGFNEPGSGAHSITRVVDLTEETRAANKAPFSDREVPRQALSMGIGSILKARELWLLATGESKAETIKYLMNHHDDPKCPVTFLKHHPRFNLVLDPAAASKISLKI